LLFTRQSPASSKGGHFFTVGKNNWLIPVSNQHNHPFQLDGWIFTALHSGDEIERPETIGANAIQSASIPEDVDPDRKYTHGLESIQHLGMDRPDEEFGYRFKPSSEQIDIPVEEYGQMVVTPDFVEKQIATTGGVSLLEKRLSYWWGHQDLYILRRVD
jgi:hypothetical protein